MNGVKFPIFPFEEVRTRFEAGILSFLNSESKLFAARIGERTMCAHLAEHLKRTFAPWDADFDYDAFGDIRKRSPIASRKRTKNPQRHLVTPDIIVHNPLHPLENLLAIEAKPEDDRRGTAADREKLRSYQGLPLSYPYVAVLILTATKEPVCRYELFHAGENPQNAKPSIMLTGAPYRE